MYKTGRVKVLILISGHEKENSLGKSFCKGRVLLRLYYCLVLQTYYDGFAILKSFVNRNIFWNQVFITHILLLHLETTPLIVIRGVPNY